MFIHNLSDTTIAREHIKRWKAIASEYELVKAKHHPRYKFVSDFFNAVGIKRQNFHKFYSRFKESPRDEAFLPQKRGPRYKTRRTLPFISNKVELLRAKGLSKFDIFFELKPKLKNYCPSLSTIYNISKRANMGRLTPKEQKARRMIIKQKAGDMGHFDCHYLPMDTVKNIRKLYLIGGIDDATRLAWVEVVTHISSLEVMFGTQEILSVLKGLYGIQFKEILTDNGSEFKGKLPHHPFERMLELLKIKHRYTRPGRPQTNGKIERFWRTLNEDLIEGSEYDSLEEFQKELSEYMIYYNEHRGHSSLKHQTPHEFCQRII